MHKNEPKDFHFQLNFFLHFEAAGKRGVRKDLDICIKILSVFCVILHKKFRFLQKERKKVILLPELPGVGKRDPGKNV